MDYVIGCDVGSQGTKAVLLSFDGKLIGEAYAGYEIDFPSPLWAQQPAERWTRALHTVIAQLLHTTHVHPKSIRGLALASQVDGVVPIDAAGTPLYPAIIWMDRRATTQTNTLRAQADLIFNRTGLNLDATHVAPKIRWLAENEPHIYDQAAHFLLPGSYLAYHLTGELAIDYSNASSSFLLDVRAANNGRPKCARTFKLTPRASRPSLRQLKCSARYAQRSPPNCGLSPQTRVMIGSGDEHAACLGAGVLTSGIVGDIAGTAEPVCAVSDQLVFDETRLIETHCHADENQWLLENPGFVSGGNLRWYRDQFGAAEVPPPGTRRDAYQSIGCRSAQQIPPVPTV